MYILEAEKNIFFPFFLRCWGLDPGPCTEVDRYQRAASPALGSLFFETGTPNLNTPASASSELGLQECNTHPASQDTFHHEGGNQYTHSYNDHTPAINLCD